MILKFRYRRKFVQQGKRLEKIPFYKALLIKGYKRKYFLVSWSVDIKYKTIELNFTRHEYHWKKLELVSIKKYRVPCDHEAKIIIPDISFIKIK